MNFEIGELMLCVFDSSLTFFQSDSFQDSQVANNLDFLVKQLDISGTLKLGSLGLSPCTSILCSFTCSIQDAYISSNDLRNIYQFFQFGLQGNY